jgi:acetoacetate decarboxylase
VRRIIGTHHFIADLTLPYGRVLHDYLLAGE